MFNLKNAGLFLSTLFIIIPVHAEVSTYPKSANSVQVNMLPVILTTDKGSPVKAFKMLDNAKDNSTNNHGWTFLDGQFWMNNDQVPIVLKDEYKEISYKDIKAGDIIIRYENEKKEKVAYSLTACQPKIPSDTCVGNPQPPIFLYTLSPDRALKYPEKTKIFRKIDSKS